MNGITYSHEHMVIDLSKIKGNQDCYLNVYEEALNELRDLKDKGVCRIVDCSNRGMGVDWDINKRISEETGIEIVNSTGFCKDPFLPQYVHTSDVEVLEEIMLNDIKNGAKIIGEIGTSKDKITPDEKKVFLAACKAQRKTNTVIITHTTLGTMALEQIHLFEENNVNLKKIIISHAALKNDFNLIEKIVQRGANVAFDTIGKLAYLSDDTTAEFIKRLIDSGYSGQLLLSMDLTRKSHLKKNGGNGYAYLVDTFVPLLLSKGIKEEAIEKIMCKNFTEILEA